MQSGKAQVQEVGGHSTEDKSKSELPTREETIPDQSYVPHTELHCVTVYFLIALLILVCNVY